MKASAFILAAHRQVMCGGGAEQQPETSRNESVVRGDSELALRTYFAVVATNMMLRRRMTTILMVVLILEMLVAIAADGEMSHCDDGVHDGQAKSGRVGNCFYYQQ